MQQYIDLKALSRVKELPVLAKMLAQGFLQGLHSSQQRGVGIEFSQYRVYEPGDDLSKIDWKLFARSDRYFVREAERESDINIWFVIDSSLSMSAISSCGISKSDNQKNSAISKLEYAKYLCATMAYLAQKQGDSIGLLGLNQTKQNYVPSLHGERHWQKLLIALSHIEAEDRFPTLENIKSKLAIAQRRGLIIIISDFCQHDSEIISTAKHLVNARTDVVVLQLVNNDELNFPYKGAIRFEDIESKEQRLVSAKQARKYYFEQQKQFQQTLKKQCYQTNISHFVANVDTPLEDTLFDLLRMRNRVNRR